MKTLLRILLGGGLLLAALAHAGDPTPNQQMYVRYCGACHGPTGQGDGLAGTFITPKPTDLTTFAKRNGGFDSQKLAVYIDGTTPVGPHGPREMPVWGELLREEGATRTEVRAKVGAIVEYLRSIQVK